MAKAAVSKTKRGKPVAAGKAPDGVVILMPAVRPDNFTYREIRKTVDLVKSKERSVEREAGSIRSGSAAPK